MFGLFAAAGGSRGDPWEFDLESVHSSEAAALTRARQVGWDLAAFDRKNKIGMSNACYGCKTLCVIEELLIDPDFTAAEMEPRINRTIVVLNEE